MKKLRSKNKMTIKQHLPSLFMREKQYSQDYNLPALSIQHNDGFIFNTKSSQRSQISILSSKTNYTQQFKQMCMTNE
ncbi:hypothetical protein SS50377_27826 [Spironucleus salmonicida]|uniref:Uncharacterized protein n=1 Tax=Spironucleus salmonicida TaxID=348837 RepID=A0A9P8RUM5_9EUKA|nr:hypothetical protein SS50377_27826 [Spironucleus salmonicida]